MYVDVNNLYRWEMSQYLPYSRFKWLNQNKIDKFCLNLTECNSIEKNSSDGYTLEVYLEYPNQLHKSHNDYTLAPEKHEISDNMLSNYCSNIGNKYNIKVKNLGNKSKHVFHYRNLQLYLSLGIKLVSVHENLKFKQTD